MDTMKRAFIISAVVLALFMSYLYWSYDNTYWGTPIKEIEEQDHTKIVRITSWSRVHIRAVINSCSLVQTKWAYDGKGNGWGFLTHVEWKIYPIPTTVNSDGMPVLKGRLGYWLYDVCWRLTDLTNMDDPI